MATLAHLRPLVPETLVRVVRRPPVSPVAILLVVLALSGVAWTLLGSTSAAPPAPTVPPVARNPNDLPRGDIPFIGDPIRDLTIWWSSRLSDASRAGLASLQGHYLTPLDPMADDVVKNLYGKILMITIPLLALGGVILGYLIMTSRTTGETAYSARAVTPRFVVGATLSVLGIFLVSVFAQFVIATDLAMVGVAVPNGAVGGSDSWPASGGVFQVLQNASFDPRIPQGPNNWNDGAWLSAGLGAAVLVTLLQMVNAALSAISTRSRTSTRARSGGSPLKAASSPCGSSWRPSTSRTWGATCSAPFGPTSQRSCSSSRRPMTRACCAMNSRR